MERGAIPRLNDEPFPLPRIFVFGRATRNGFLSCRQAKSAVRKSGPGDALVLHYAETQGHMCDYYTSQETTMYGSRHYVRGVIV